MRALVKVRPGRGLELRDVARPEPGPGEVAIQVRAADVCGSDVARYTWTRNYDAGQPKDMTRDLPRILGHEFAGEVSAVGAGVQHPRLGDAVAVQNILGCGRCEHCLAGYRNVCAHRRTIGVHVDGGYAETAVVPAQNCTVIDPGMSFHLAAALQPFAVATHAVAQAALEPGARIAVWGLGPVGMAVCLAAVAQGAEVVAALDLNRERIRVAGGVGLPAVHAGDVDVPEWLAATHPARSIDAFFDAAGAAESILAALSRLKKRSPVVLIGNIGRPVTVDLMPVVMDEQRVLGSRSYSIASWDDAVRTIASTPYEQTLSPTVDLEHALERFEHAASGGGGPFTILPNQR